jgi:hypothetical protein
MENSPEPFDILGSNDNPVAIASGAVETAPVTLHEGDDRRGISLIVAIADVAPSTPVTVLFQYSLDDGANYIDDPHPGPQAITPTVTVPMFTFCYLGRAEARTARAVITNRDGTPIRASAQAIRWNPGRKTA